MNLTWIETFIWFMTLIKIYLSCSEDFCIIISTQKAIFTLYYPDSYAVS